MCGFAGIFTTQGHETAQLRERVGDMIDTLAHRGPDDEGVWSETTSGIALGFRRLAIVDLSAHGHQPMRSRLGRYTIVFNGEVYNHRELRMDLEQVGFPFRGHSDTEVVLAAFERWGIDAAVRRFTGMFAMAVWDADTGSLSLVRDHLGIKPLYVHGRAGTVLFGSELKALLAHPAFDRSIDPHALATYLRYMFVPAPWSIFRGTIKLRPGTILTVRDPGDPLPDPEPYWSAFDAARGSLDPLQCTETEAIEELDRLLRRAVELQMRSDVPLGALLSGGIDSSTVVSFMQAASDRPVKTFHIGFDDERFDESAHASAVARHLGTDHTAIRLTGAEALAVVPRIARIFDEPFANPSQIPALLVCELARKNVTVAVSGDGGDEVFGGYNRYIYGGPILAWVEPVPRLARTLAARALTAATPARWDRIYRAMRPVLPEWLEERLVGDKLHKLAEILDAPPGAPRYRALLSAWQRPEALVRGAAERWDSLDRAFTGVAVPGLVDRMMLADQTLYLPDDLLTKIDRVSMAVALEVRVPLLDHHVVEYAWRLRPSLKIRGRHGKWLLRQVLYRRVPEPLVERPKMGFSVPIEGWLRGPLRAWAADLIESKRLEETGLLDAASIRRAWRAFQVGSGRAAPAIWAVLMFEAWRQQWLDGTARVASSPALEAAS